MDNALRITMTDGPLAAMKQQPIDTGAGARIVFEGFVRPVENNTPILGLDYEAYQPMAQQQLQAIGRALIDQYNLIAMDIEHSIGFVPNNACSFRLIIASAHRKEALNAMDAFIDRLKQDVPIWKSPRFA